MTLAKFVDSRTEMTNRGRSMSEYEPLGLGPPHPGVRATGAACCEAGRTRPAWPGRDCPASASVHQPPGQTASRPSSSPQTSADAEEQRKPSVHQRGEQQRPVPTAAERTTQHVYSTKLHKNKQKPWLIKHRFWFIFLLTWDSTMSSIISGLDDKLTSTFKAWTWNTNYIQCSTNTLNFKSIYNIEMAQGEANYTSLNKYIDEKEQNKGQ